MERHRTSDMRVHLPKRFKSAENRRGCELGLFAAAVCASVAAFATPGFTTVYKNDFSARTSLTPVPASRWSTTTYTPDATLYYNFSGEAGNGAGYRAVAANTAFAQDGWQKVYDQSRTNEADCVVQSGGGNPYAAFINDGTLSDINTRHRTHVIHPFFNIISNGVLRMSIDICAPRAYSSGTLNLNFFVGPLYQTWMGGYWKNNSFQYPGLFGPNRYGSTNDIRAYSFGGNGNAGNVYAGAYEGSTLTAGNWYRYVVDYDFDNKKLSGVVYDMGSTTPSLDSTGTQWATLREHPFWKNPDANTGPVTGFIIRDVGSISGKGDAFDESLAPRVDNIRCWWRASGTAFTDADLFYENDFATCRVRTLVPDGTTSCSYPLASTTKTYTWDTLYPVNAISGSGLPGYQLMPNATGSNTAIQPIGVDGWRRLNGNGHQHGSVVKSTEGAGNWMMAVAADSGDHNRYSIFAQPLGQTVSNGSVRLSVDFRTPDKWYHGTASARNIRIMLAPESYYNSYNDSQQTTLYAARIGMDGAGGVNDFKFLRVGSSTTTASGGASNHWYRAVMTVDIDAKTYDTMIFDMGETSAAYNAATPPDSQAVFSSSGEPLKNGQLPEISCFALMTMGAGGELNGTFNEKGIIYFDNIFAWRKNADETTWHQIYYNDFNTRRRYDVPFTGRDLTATLNRTDGTDWWKSLGDGPDQLVARSGTGNPFAHRIDRAVPAWNGGGHYYNSRYVFGAQPIGTNLTKGVVTMWADIRPPRRWGNNDGAAHVTFGTDDFFRGNMLDQYYNTRYFARFGFGCRDTTTVCGLRDSVNFLVAESSGNRVLTTAADPSHWYRFKATTRFDQGTWDLEVYDLGTAHPTFDTPTPSVSVLSLTGLAYRAALDPRAGEGISTVSLGDVGSYPDDLWNPEPLSVALFDNIRVEHKPASGFLVIFK